MTARPRPVLVSVTARLTPHDRDRSSADRWHFRTAVTPGVLDGAARHAYRHGQCHALAVALHERTGWPILALWKGAVDPDGVPAHLAVGMPDGRLLDIEGAHTDSVMVDGLREPAAASLTRIVLRETPVLEARRLHTRTGRSRWCDLYLPPHLSVARSYVDPVLSLVGQRARPAPLQETA